MIIAVFIYSSDRRFIMRLPSPVKDYEEKELSLDEHLISHHAATYFKQAAQTNYKNVIISEALLVTEAS